MFDGEQPSWEGWELGKDPRRQKTWLGLVFATCLQDNLAQSLLVDPRENAPPWRPAPSPKEPSAIPTARAHTPQLWEGATLPFHFSLGTCVGGWGLLLSCSPLFHSVPQQSPTDSVGKQQSGLRSQSTNFRNFRAALVLATAIHPHLAVTLSPPHK